MRRGARCGHSLASEAIEKIAERIEIALGPDTTPKGFSGPVSVSKKPTRPLKRSWDSLEKSRKVHRLDDGEYSQEEIYHHTQPDKQNLSR